VDTRPASGAETLLKVTHVRQLIEIAGQIPDKFPPIRDDQGRPAPADVELAFVDDRLQLLQIRPFLESRKARGSTYLQSLDRPIRQRASTSVPMKEVPAR
jgi:hypothetical protein